MRVSPSRARDGSAPVATAQATVAGQTAAEPVGQSQPTAHATHDVAALSGCDVPATHGDGAVLPHGGHVRCVGVWVEGVVELGRQGVWVTW